MVMKSDLAKGFENVLSKYPRNSNLNNSLNDGAAAAYMSALADVANTLKCSGIPEYEKLGHELGKLKRHNLCNSRGEKLEDGRYVCAESIISNCEYMCDDFCTPEGVRVKEECPTPQSMGHIGIGHHLTPTIDAQKIKDDGKKSEKKKTEVIDDGDYDLF